jgi:hypothetical protein
VRGLRFCSPAAASSRRPDAAYESEPAPQDDLGYLSDVPLLYLVILVVGVPLSAAAAGWFVAGREPPAIARPVME